MAHQHWDQPYSLPVAANLSANDFPFVAINTSGQLALPAAGADIDGILDNARDCTAAGKQGRFFWSGVLKVKLGGTVTKGANLSVGANGLAVVSVTSGHKLVCKALAAGVAGDIVEVFVKANGYGAVP